MIWFDKSVMLLGCIVEVFLLFDYFFNWIMRSITKCINIEKIYEKRYFFCYIETIQKDIGFLKGFQYHGILKNEIKDKGDIGCYTYCH